VLEALQCLADHGQYSLPDAELTTLLDKGYATHLAQVAKGTFLGKHLQKTSKFFVVMLL